MRKGKPRQPKLAGSHVPFLEHANRTKSPKGCSSPMVRKTTASKLAVDKSQKRRLLKVASYNINGINPRLPVLLRWLEQFQPDIVGLQELKCTDQAFPASDIEALGYSAIWHGEQRWNGVAILS